MLSINATPALLAVDAGNTQIKWGLLSLEPGDFAATHCQSVIADKLTPSMFDLSVWARDAKASVQGVMLSSVRTPAETQTLFTEIQRAFPVVQCGQLQPERFPFPFPVQYELAELGADRLMNVLGLLALSNTAKQEGAKQNADDSQSLWIAVDAGTCCTIDVYCSEKNHPEYGYRGGWILPGLQMQAKAMTTFTARLPDISEKLCPDQVSSFQARDVFLGTNTEMCMLKGLQQGYPDMILGLLKRLFLSQNLAPEQPHYAIILTGGDAAYLEKALSPYLPHLRVEPQLNFIGLRQAWQLLDWQR